MCFLHMGILKTVLLLLCTTIVYNDFEILYRNVKYTTKCMCPFFFFFSSSLFFFFFFFLNFILFLNFT